jgi:hypothetical protein
MSEFCCIPIRQYPVLVAQHQKEANFVVLTKEAKTSVTTVAALGWMP